MFVFQLAEKRKANLDELAIQYQKDCDKHREQMLTMENESETKVKALQTRLDQEQVSHNSTATVLLNELAS